VTSDYAVFLPYKSPEHKLTGAKEIKALQKHTQTTIWLVITRSEKCKDFADNLKGEVLPFH